MSPEDTRTVSQTQIQDLLRALPRIGDLLREPDIIAAASGVPYALVREALRAVLDEEREAIRTSGVARAYEDLIAACSERIGEAALPHLRCAVNATGVIIHTNLGRAPLAASVADHVADVAAHYSTLEFDTDKGCRGSRQDHVAELLCRLIGAEDAVVINNNAAAVLLVLTAFAQGREAVVSRGELIEIGGSFRIPDIMALSGAQMVEVGTTNKTHLTDFEQACTPDTALILKVHPSNYRIVGFHEEVDVAALAVLAHERGILVYEDQGSGSLADPEALDGHAGEHTPGWSLEQGADLVSFSGDKLLGAGQAGIIMGSRELIGRLKHHPLMRALRPDKMTLASLETTLRIYLDPEQAWDEIPVLSMVRMPADKLYQRACTMLGQVEEELTRRGCTPRRNGDELLQGISTLRVVPVSGRVGGGALPTTELPGHALSLAIEGIAPNDLRAHLVGRRPRPVIARVSDDTLLCDVRTLLDARDEEDVVAALADEIAGAASAHGASAAGAEI